ncbi:MAG TPA: DMT family transporter [Candidatus Cloacimonadota bacterium]|nr:DMT family transporter [Candidatus Cloacimonadota bacterium]HPS38158.1 DMT family transporter [Candidatus Cloacimonadota bacterium]
MQLRSHLFCLATIILWSTLELTGKLVGESIDPFTLTAWRFVIGGLALMPIAIRQNRSAAHRLTFGSILVISGLGILNVCISMLLLQLAIYFGKASVTAVIMSMNPLFVGLFAMLILNEKMSRNTVLGLLAGLIGLIIMIVSEPELGSHAFKNLPLSLLLASLSAIVFGLYTVLTKHSVQLHGNTMTNSGSFIAGGITLLIINAVIGKPVIFDVTFRNVGFILYLGLMLTGLSYLLYFEAMKVLGAAKASIYFFLKPVLASILAVVILAEKLSPWQIAGIAIIITALSRETIIGIFERKEV